MSLRILLLSVVCLFNDNMSEEIMFLDSQLPTVTSRFQTSSATTLQQDHFFRASDNVTDILNKAISTERLSDMHSVSVNLKSTSIIVHFLRSLYDLTKIYSSKPKAGSNLNFFWADSTWFHLVLSGRLDFLHTLWWMLGSDNKLYIL